MRVVGWVVGGLFIGCGAGLVGVALWEMHGGDLALGLASGLLVMILGVMRLSVFGGPLE